MHFEYSQCLILSLVAESNSDSKVTYMRNMFEKCEKSTRQNGRKSEDEKTYSKESHLISPGTAHSEQDVRKVSQSVVVHLIIAIVINIT